MPTKRTRALRHRRYPPIVEALLAGAELEKTEETKQALLMIFYCGWRDQLPDEVIERARDQLDEWLEREGR